MNFPRALTAAAWVGAMIALTAAVYLAGIKAEGFTLFEVERIEVRGNLYTSQGEIMEAMAVVEGEGLFSIDIDDVTARVERLPWVSSAGIYRRLPDTVILEVREYKPSYIVSLDRLYYMTTEGHVIDAPLGNGLDLPVINGVSWAELEAPGPAREGLMRVLGLLESGAFEGRVDELHYDATYGFTLYGELPLAARAVGLFLGKEEIDERFRRYGEMKRMLAIRGQYAATADLSFEDRIVAKLQALPTGAGGQER